MLEPNTKYVFELAIGSSYGSADWAHGWKLVQKTWPNDTSDTTAYPLAPASVCGQSSNPFTVQSQSQTLVISQGGNATQGYCVYNGKASPTAAKALIHRDGAGNNSAGMEDDSNHGIVVKASYVIIRNVQVTGAAINGIHIRPDFHDVIIEDSEISDWSWRHGQTGSAHPSNPSGWGDWGVNESAAVYTERNNSRIVIQRNIITSPHFGANPWDADVNAGQPGHCTTNDGPSNHPIGPNGISVEEGGGQNVIRYNELTAGPNDPNKAHWYNDGIGGADNDSPVGAPGPDSDIYQNIVMNVFDDGIEAEGGGRNVRVWGNYISDSKSGIAATPAHYGPLYAWRNVMNRLRECYTSAISNPDNDWAPSGFKFGRNQGPYGDGMRYVFHNTMLQQTHSTYPLGGKSGIEGPDGGVTYTLALNNILQVKKNDWHGARPGGGSLSLNGGCSVEAEGNVVTGSSFDYNAVNGAYCAGTSGSNDVHFLDTVQAETNPAITELYYRADNGPSSAPALNGGGTGSYQLDPNSKGYQAGFAIPNFSDGFKGSKPDIGAHEGGTDPMTFGRAAVTGGSTEIGRASCRERV